MWKSFPSSTVKLLASTKQSWERLRSINKESGMHKHFVGRSLSILLFLTCISCAALAVTLEGTALDPGGKAVAGARVSILRSLVVVSERQTDARGGYTFEGLQEGVYQLTASARGMSSPAIELDLSKSATKKQDIKLEISAVSSQIVVSASLGGALAPQLGSSVDVVTQQDIEVRNAQNASDVIRGIPGLEISQSGRRGSVAGIYMRGGESTYTAVMMDGIPLNEFGGRFDFASLPADGLERIEVIRGPQSALFGPNAVAGVINLISRQGKGAPKFTALAEGGSYATRRFATGGSGINRGFNWSYNLSRTDSNGVVVNDNSRNQSAFLSLGYHQSRRQLDFHFFGNANSSGTPGPYGSDPNNFLDPKYKINTKSHGKQNLFGYQFGYTENITKKLRQVTTVSVAANNLFSFNHYHDAMWGDSDSTYASDNLHVVVNTRSEISLSADNVLSAGFEFNREETEQATASEFYNSRYWVPRNSFAYFVEDRWNLSNRLFLTAGVRVDTLRTDALKALPASSIVKINPRISLAYLAPKGTRIHGSFGTGIRPPNGFELSVTNNPGLKPEKSISFDSGVEQNLFKSRAVVDVTYFFNRFKDQIISLGGSSVSDLSRYSSANLKNSRAQGIESSFRLHPIQSLELGVSYTFLDSSVLALDGSNKTTAPFTVGQDLLRRPRHTASYGVTWNYGRLTLNTTAYIRGATLDVDPTNSTYACTGYGYQCFFTNKGYTRADAGFSFRVAKGVEVYGRVNNLLNRNYEEIFGYPANRVNFMGGMKFSLQTE
jgi:outer membrane cobalamin receptor